VRRSRQAANVALGLVLGAIALSFVLAFMAGVVGGDAEGLANLAGFLVFLPAFLLLVPVALVAVVVDYAGRRAYPARPIAASWNVLVDGEVHIVSLPSSRSGAPRQVWVDGVSTPLAWVPNGITGSRAKLDAGTFSGTLVAGTDPNEVAAEIGIGIVSAIVGGVVGGRPSIRYVLQVDGADVDAVPVRDGERRR
jgi:hypothetical protein